MDYQVIEFIRDKLSEKKLSLKDLTDEVSEKFDFKLTSSDLSFIHIQYRNTLIELWIEECLGILKVKIESNELSDDSIFELLTLFRSLHAFDGTPDYLQGEVYKLIKAEREIFTPKNFINPRMEISVFLKTTLTKLQEKAKQDYEFYEILVQVLRNSYVHLDLLIKTLKVTELANSEASIYDISRNVLANDFDINHYDELKKVSVDLKPERSPIEKTVQEMVKSYIEELKLEEIMSGGLKILKLKKKLLLSDDLDSIEIPKDVAEIHIICDIFHIDKDLPEKYHGLNILVVSNIIKLHQVSTWDLSGHHAVQKYSENAGQLSNGDGKNGSDGEPGESGANCEIFSTEIINAELWTIISNGGSGSNGQDGGNGADGADGRDIQESDFKILGEKITKENFVNLLGQLEVSTEIGSRRMNYYDDGLEKQLIFDNDTVVAELFMLIRGTRGKVGALGGFGGFCGRGGFSGNIIINSESKGSKIISFNGSDGKNGTNGFNGRDGTDGGDACVMMSSSDETYKGLNQQKKIHFLTSNEKKTMSIFYKPTESYFYADVMSEVVEPPQGEQLTLEEQISHLKRDEKGLYDSLNSVFKNANEKFSKLIEKIKLQSYLNNEIDFSSFASEIVKNQFDIYNYDILQSFAKFYTDRPLKIEQEIRELLESFIKKSDLVNDSGEIKITKKIVTTTDLNQISKNFDKLSLICDILHINSNLSKSFRGRNLQIHANKIIVHKNAVLDTSGVDYYIFDDCDDLLHDDDECTTSNNQDQKYKDGGNVFIESDFIENASLLSIKSVGGDSSNLKDGIDPQADDFIINGKLVTEFPVENETYIEGNFTKNLIQNLTTSLLIVKGSDAPIIKTGIPGKIFIKSEEEIFKKEIEVIDENQQISDGRDIVMHVQDENVATYGLNQNHKYELMTSQYELENSIEFEGEIYYPKLSRVISNKSGIDDLELLDHLIWVLRNSYDKFDEVVEQLKLKALMTKYITIKQLVKLISSENFDIGNYQSLVKCAENFVSNPAYHQIYFDTIFEFTSTEQSTNSNKLIIKQKIYVSSQLDLVDSLDQNSVEEDSVEENIDVTEIQIICDTLHIDSDLPDSFRGMNLAIVANYVQVHKSVTWDLSGLPLKTKNALPKAGQYYDGSGIDGRDGNAGNSGGNFSLYCKTIENASGLKIVSNGSDGSDGQEGGNGRDGKDGKDATANSFKKNGEEFKVHFNIANATGLEKRFGNSFITDDGLHAYLVYGKYEGNIFTSKRSAYMLVKGSDGAPGLSGGLPGYGGQGGFAGEILINCEDSDMIKNVKIVAKSGNNGNIGRASYNGAAGRDGRDLYKLDRTFEKEATLFGQHANVKYNMVWNDTISILYNYEGKYFNMIEKPNQRPLKSINSSTLARDREIFVKSKKNSPIDINQIHQDNSLFLSDNLSAIATQISQESSKAFKLLQTSKKNELTNFHSNYSKISHVLSAHDNIELRTAHSKLEAVKKSDILVQSVINEYSDEIKASRNEVENISKKYAGVASELEMEQAEILTTTSVQLKFDKQPKMSSRKAEINSRIFYKDLLDSLNDKIDIKTLQSMIRESRFDRPKYINLAENMELYGIQPKQRKPPKNEKILQSLLEKFMVQNGQQADSEVTKYARLYQNKDPQWKKCVDNPKVIKCLMDSANQNQPAFMVNYLKNSIKNSTLTIDDVALICSEKILQKFYNEIYIRVQKQELSNDQHVSYISENFLHQMKFLKDTGIFKSHLEKLDKHFQDGGDDEKTEVLSYFLMNVNNFQIGLLEAVFNLLTDFADDIEEISNILNEYAQEIVKIQSEVEEVQENSYKAISDAERAVNCASKMLENTSKISLNPLDFFYRNNKKEKTKTLMKEFYNNEQVIKFIKNDIQSNGISSQVYRKILFFKYNLKSVIFVEDNNRNLVACEDHNYPHDYWFQYNTSEDLLQKSEQQKELFLLFKDDKFSILELQSSTKYKAFAKRQQVQRSLKSVVSALKTGSDYPEHLKIVSKKFGITKNKFLSIFDVTNPWINVDTLADIIMSHFPLIVKKYDKNGVEEFAVDEMNGETVNDVITKPDENDLNPPHYEVYNDKKVRDLIKFNLTIIANLDGLSILYAIAIRLYNDKNSHKLLDFGLVVQVILSLIVEAGSLSHLLTFLILGNEPENWSYELAIIKLENHFGIIDEDLKTKWKKQSGNVKNAKIMLTFLEKVIKLEESNEKLIIEDLDDIFENIEYFGTGSIRNLKNSSLTSWKLMPTENYWKQQIDKLKSSKNDKKFENLKDVFEDMSSKYGSNAKELMKILQNKKKELPNFNVAEFLSNFTVGETKLNQKVLNDLSSTDISKWSDVIDQQKLSANVIRDAKKIVEIIKEDDEASPNVKAVIEEIGQNVRDIFKLICAKRNKKYMDYTELEVKEWRKELSTPNVLECLAIITRSFQIMTDNKITLRDTQLMSILTMWRNNNGLLMQVSTGEGKTFIGVSFAILKVLHKEKVDIITSSSVLAIRDTKENKKFFDFFDISVDHNCHESSEKRKSAYTSQVVYGILGNFQRDYLLTSFYNENFLSGHHFNNVLVDEVDSMLLDKGNNILYLSSELPDIDEIEGMFVYIWFYVTQHSYSHKQKAELKNTEKTKKIILDNCFGVVDAEDIKQMNGQIDEQKIISKLNSHGIIEDNNLICIQKYESTKFDEALNDVDEVTREKIKIYCKTKIEKEKLIQFPGYLKDFVLLHIGKWINSAIRALSLQNEKEYIIDRTNDGQDLSSDPKIIILDIDTGTDMTNSQWDEGLHQFLQLKHGCRLTRISLKSVFISNVSYFKKYNKLYGMTGTLGSLDERQKTTEIHKIDFVTIPRYTSHKFVEYPSIQAFNDNEWIDKIHGEVVEMFNKNRSTLVICETIQDTRIIEKDLMTNPSLLFSNKNVHVYQRDSKEFYSEKLTPRHVIISTNLAGRGTDIKLSKELNDAGGLHVILTYLPQNKRIENQAFGRASRAGDKGSGRLITYADSDQTISEMKNLRNQNEIQRLDEINRYYKNFITIEEKFFANFHNSYLELKSNFNSGKRHKRLTSDKYHVEDEPILQKIYLENYKIQFSFWLDKNSVHLDNWKNENNSNVVSKSFELFIQQNPEIHPVKLIEMYNKLENSNKKDEAKKLLDEFASDENDKTIAKAYTECYEMLSKNQRDQNYKIRSLSHEEEKKLRNCINLFESKIHNRDVRLHLIKTLSKKMNKNLIEIEGFKKQQEIMDKIDEYFIESIQRFLGIEMTPVCFNSSEFNVPIMTSELFKTLIEKGCIENYTIDASAKVKVIKAIAEKYFIDPEMMRKFLNGNSKFNSIDKFEEALRNEFKMPSRNEFWEILKTNQILKNEKEYLIINLNNLGDIDPSLFDKLPAESLDTSKTENNVISLTNIGKIDKNINRVLDSIKFKKVFNMTDSCRRFNYLLNNNAISIIKRAEFDLNQFNNVKISEIFKNFNSIKLDDFKKFGKSSENILKKLINSKILIKNDGKNFSLNYEALGQLSESDRFLGDESVYQEQVQKLLNNKFSYTIALCVLAKKIKENIENSQSSINTQIHLYNSPHLQLLNDLIHYKIIKIPITNANNIDECKKIDKPELFKNEKLKIESNIFEKDETIKVLEKYAKIIVENDEKINAMLKSFVPALLNQDWDAVEVITEPIEEIVAQKLGNPLSPEIKECVQIFKSKGLNVLMNVKSKAYSTKFWWKIIGLVLIIIVQVCIVIALTYLTGGVALFFGRVFIQEIVSDIMYLGQAIWSGEFSWADYGSHKLKSVMSSVFSSLFGFKIIGGEATVGNILKTVQEKLFDKVSFAIQSYLSGFLSGIIIKKVTEGLSDHVKSWFKNDFFKKDGLGSYIDKLTVILSKFEIMNFFREFYAKFKKSNTVFNNFIKQGIFYLIFIIKTINEKMAEKNDNKAINKQWFIWGTFLATAGVALSYLLYCYNTFISHLKEAVSNFLNAKKFKPQPNFDSNNECKDDKSSEEKSCWKQDVLKEISSVFAGEICSFLHNTTDSLITTASESVSQVSNDWFEKKTANQNEINETNELENIIQEMPKDNQGQDTEAEMENFMANNEEKLNDLQKNSVSKKVQASITETFGARANGITIKSTVKILEEENLGNAVEVEQNGKTYLIKGKNYTENSTVYKLSIDSKGHFINSQGLPYKKDGLYQSLAEQNPIISEKYSSKDLNQNLANKIRTDTKIGNVLLYNRKDYSENGEFQMSNRNSSQQAKSDSPYYKLKLKFGFIKSLD